MEILQHPAVWLTGLLFILLMATGATFARMYRRASKETSFVRTGLGGQKVIMNGGALVLPVLHETILVNMNTLRLEVRRAHEQALITKDRMRVDVLAEFYVRVQPTADAIANAAQTLGQRTMRPDMLKELVEGKFVDALRSVAAEMTMEELHEQRVHFVQRVQATVSEDLLKNGLELEAVSLTGLDQTQIEYLNPKNAFDAQGLTRLTETIEARRKQRNDIEQDTEVAISQKNLVAEQQKLEIEREKEYARLAQQREVEVRRAQQTAEIAEQRAAREREAKQAEISARQQVEQTEIAARQNVEEQRIESVRRLREQDIARNRDLEAAEVQRRQVVSLTEQERAIVVAQKSKAQSEAQAEADKARAAAVQAEELVITTRERAKAERAKQIDLVRAAEDAETKAILVTVAAEAEKKAAEDKARAIATLAEAEANKTRLVASGEAEAEKLRAEGAERRYEVDAAGRRALHEADNLLSTDQIAMQVRLAIVRALPQIIAESVKPMERIDGIKIMQLDGLTGGRTGGYTHDGDAPSAQPARGNLAEEVVSSALRYRAQAPIVDGLMKELGITGLSGPELGSSLIAATRPAGPTHDDGDDGDPGNAPGNGIAAGAFGA